MGKKKGSALGQGLMKANSKPKQGRSVQVAQQAGFIHTTDMQDGYDWGRLNLQVTLFWKYFMILKHVLLSL